MLSPYAGPYIHSFISIHCTSYSFPLHTYIHTYVRTYVRTCLATYFRFSFRCFKKGSCQLLAKVCARSTGQPLRRVVRFTDRPDMTLDVYRGRKTTIQQRTYVDHMFILFPMHPIQFH